MGLIVGHGEEMAEAAHQSPGRGQQATQEWSTETECT